jgi:hypothetical protein
VSPNWIEAGVVLLLVLSIPVTVLVVYLIWRDGYVKGWRAARRDVGVHCPRCGYSLAGLTHARCPECGVELTLDDLWRRYVAVCAGKERAVVRGERSMKPEEDPTTHDISVHGTKD